MFKNSKPDTIYLQCFINKKDLTSSEQTFVRDWVNLKWLYLGYKYIGSFKKKKHFKRISKKQVALWQLVII